MLPDDLPTLNAILNSVTTLFLLTGYGLIRARRIAAHRLCMLAAVLISHTVLATAIVPLVLVTLARALRGRFERHAALARVTLPIWLYVSITGVIVYLMLYRLPSG